MTGKILYNLQKAMVDSTISSAAGLEKESSYPAARLSSIVTTLFFGI
jgi:hypothetical protein